MSGVRVKDGSKACSRHPAAVCGYCFQLLGNTRVLELKGLYVHKQDGQEVRP